MGRADIQLHSDLGEARGSPGEILDAAERRGLDVVAITDHDDIRGAFVLRDLAARRGSVVGVVTGSEVTTRSGHLLALWIDEEVPMLRPLGETVATIHRMGGIAIVPHPLSYLTFSIGEGALRRLAETADPERLIDGIELANPSIAGRVRRAQAVRVNRHMLRVAETGSSDAHHPSLVGSAWTEFEGTTPAELRAGILARTTSGHGRHWTVGEHLEGIVEQQWRSMVRDPLKRARMRVGARKRP